jgi:hypothetical protein
MTWREWLRPRPKRQRGPVRRIATWSALLIGALFASVTAAPQLLAWPYHAKIGETDVYSVAPIPAEMEDVLERSDRLLEQSPLHTSIGARKVFLTDGGWRWNLLALTSRDAFALRRPLRDAIIVNRAEVAADRVDRDTEVAGSRSLSGTLAHEATHILVARRYGELRAAMLPTWKSEGFADFAAQESALSDRDYRRLRGREGAHPGLTYYEARRRVAAILRRNGGDPDALFAGP